MATEILKILAVDDIQDNLTTLKAVLADTFPGVKVFTALNGLNGIMLALTHDPDVILLDIIMPEMDGYEVCRKLKNDERTVHIPVIFLTALKTDRQSRIKALEAGAEAFLSKPPEQEELMAQVRSMAKIKASNQLQRHEKEQLEILVAERTQLLEKELTERRKAENELRQSHQNQIQNQTAMLNMLEDLKEEIEAHKKSEESLRSTQENLRQTHQQLDAIIQASPLGISALDRDGHITLWSPSAERLFGWAQDEILGKELPTIPDQIKEEIRAQIQQEIEGTIRTGMENPRQRKDGSTVEVSISTAPLRDSHGKISGSMAIYENITDRKQRERELETVTTVSAALRAASSRTEMLPVILDQLLSLLSVEGATVELLDPESGDLLIELGRGVWAPVTGERIPQGQGLSAQVLASQQPYFNNEVKKETHMYRPDLFTDVNAAAGTLLMVRSQVIGLLWIGSRRRLTSQDLRLLTAISDITANAINRATLYEQTENHLRQLTALRTIDQAIISSLDLEIILRTFVEQVAIQLEVNAVAVLLYDPLTYALEYGSGYGFQHLDIEQTHLLLGEGQAGRAALEKRTLSSPYFVTGEKGFNRAPLSAREGFVSHHATPIIVKQQLKGVLEVFHRTQLTPDPEWFEFFAAFANQAAIAIDNAQLFEGLQQSNLDLTLAYDATIEGWSRAMDLRDQDTENHTQRVTELTLQMAILVGINQDEIVHIRRGALLHDIGKLGVPDHILRKPSGLTDEEWLVMRTHPQLAYDMLFPIDYLHPALDIPYCHHEKWDGTGYPLGLKGDEIPFAARLFAIADVYDALTADRPYRKAWTHEAAIELILNEANKHFDPQVVEIFLKSF